MKNKRKTSELIKDIVNTLENEELNISEIKTKINSDWDSVRNYLEILKEINLLGEKKSGRKRIFYLKNKVDLKKVNEEKELLILKQSLKLVIGKLLFLTDEIVEINKILKNTKKELRK